MFPVLTALIPVAKTTTRAPRTFTASAPLLNRLISKIFEPSGDARADAEYLAGARDANRYLDDKRMFGDEHAEQMEIERDLKDPDGDDWCCTTLC